MSKPAKKHKFPKLPTYPGGKKAFLEFISKNLRYPQQAIDNRIEGDVHLSYEVLDTGMVVNIKVIRGIGHGCDEEAIRIIGLLHYGNVKNKGIRIRSTLKTNIHFKLPQRSSYSYHLKKEKAEPHDINEKKQSTGTYSYSIKLK